MLEDDQVMKVTELTELATSPKLGSQVVQAMMNVLQARYPVRSFYNINFRELVDEHELRHGCLCWNLWT